MLHVRVSKADPLQPLPLFKGRGFVHERDRDRNPSPHDLLQEVQELHCVKPP